MCRSPHAVRAQTPTYCVRVSAFRKNCPSLVTLCLSEYTQANRLIQVFTPLGEDALLLQSFHGTESISQLFQFELKMYSENRNLSFDSIVGKNTTIKVVLPDLSERYINGIVSAFSQGGSALLEGGSSPKFFASYRATLVPWLWFLTQTTDCRIFQNQSVPEILEAALYTRTNRNTNVCSQNIRLR